MIDSDRNNLAYWYPRLPLCRIETPRTKIVTYPFPSRLIDLMDGKKPKGWDRFLLTLTNAARSLGGTPIFLRTGYGSGKHYWTRCCYVTDLSKLSRHVLNLVEWSNLVDIIGLPTETWVVREFLPLISTFTAEGYGGMPVAREFRCFVVGGRVTCIHPYWPAGAVEDARPDQSDWRQRLNYINALLEPERDALTALSLTVAEAVPGDWSIDFAQHVDGRWFLIDMAQAQDSFHWPGCEHGRH